MSDIKVMLLLWGKNYLAPLDMKGEILGNVQGYVNRMLNACY